MFNIKSMRDKGSSYENLYTQQISEAVFDQTGHESKKAAAQKKLLEENEGIKRNFRALGYLIFAGFLGVCGYLINLDPANAGPCAVALGAFLVAAGVVYVMNK
jgi:hypothetical protein